MNYKKWIQKRSTRLMILKFCCFIPDKLMLKLQYRIKMGEKLDLKNPRRFTEKLQWYKLYYRTPLMKRCADKYEVREYVKECGLTDILIPLIGLYDKPKEINYCMLPEQFVLKDTLGSGGDAVIICKDRKCFDWDDAEKQMNKWVKESTSYKKSGGGREWVYGGRKHRIIIEHCLESNPEEGGLIDYKFFCFYGRCEYLYVIADRKLGNRIGLGIYTRDYKKLSVTREDEEPLRRKIEKPACYDKMLQIAEKLAAPFPEVRVDLYQVKGKVLFGELTFFDGSGYMHYEPDQFDFVLGKKFELPRIQK